MTVMTLLEQHDYGYGKANESAGDLTKASDKLWLYFGITLLAFGTVGHVLSLLVVIGSRRMRLLSLSVYIVTSSIVGLCALYVGLLRQILLRINDYGDIRSHSSDAWCRFHAALTYFSLQLFAWLQASVAVERAIAVWRPMHYKRWCTRQRSAIAVVAIVTFLAPFNSIVVVSFHLDNEQQCRASDHEHHVYLFDTVWGWLDFVLYSLIPASVVIPCNGLTIYRMCRSGAFRRRATGSLSIQKSREFTMMLLMHNVASVITTMPISIHFLLPPTVSDGYNLAWTICSLLQYFGTTLGFFVYSVTAGKFRKALMELLRKGVNAQVSSERASASTRSSRHSEADSYTRHRMTIVQSSTLNSEIIRRPSTQTENGENMACTSGSSCKEKLIKCQEMSL